MTFQSMLVEISSHPELCMGEVTIARIDAFMHGWMQGRQDRTENAKYLVFQDWVRRSYGDDTTCPWWHLIVRNSANLDVATVECLNKIREYCKLSDTLPTQVDDHSRGKWSSAEEYFTRSGGT